MASITPDIRLLGTLGTSGDFPIALAENVALEDGTALLDYIRRHADQWVFGHGDPPADLELGEGQRYLDQDTGRVFEAVPPVPATASYRLTVPKLEAPVLRFKVVDKPKRFIV